MNATTTKQYLSQILLLFGFAGLVSCASQPSKEPVEQIRWQRAFDHPIEFQSLLDHDLMVLGTSRHLYGIQPATGAILWRKRNLTVAAGDLTVVTDEPYILVNDAGGGSFSDNSTNVLALNQHQGEILWESSLLEGKVLQAVLDQAGDVLFVATVKGAHGDDRGFLSSALPNKGFRSGFAREPYLSALDVKTGRVLWTQPFGKEVMMRPLYRVALDDDTEWLYTRPFDLGLFHAPVVVGSNVCVTYTGIHCYDKETGAKSWGKNFPVLHDNLALSYAYPAIAGGMLITTGDRRVRAFDLDTGKRRWRSRKFDVLSNLSDPGGKMLFGQLGGRFYDIKKERWVWEGDFGVVALDKKTGKTRWRYTKADNSITNLLILEDRIWVADEKRLICLKRSDGSVCMRAKHSLENAPMIVGLNTRNQITLMGEGEAASIDPSNGIILWHANYAQPGPGAWGRFSRSLMHASGNALRFGSFVVSHAGGIVPSLAVPLAGVNIKLISGKKLVSQKSAQMGRKLVVDAHADTDNSAVEISDGYQYFVFQSDGSEDHTLAVVNLTTGETEHQIPLHSEFPNFAIDEGNGLIYEIQGKRLVAMSIEWRITD